MIDFIPTLPIPRPLTPIHLACSVLAVDDPEERAGKLVVELLLAADQCLCISKTSGGDRSTCLPLAAAGSLTWSDTIGSPHEIH